MFKKIGIVTALSSAILFGGALNSSVDASASDQSQNQSYKAKVNCSVNGDWQQFSNKDITSFIANYFSKNNWSNKDWNKAKVEQKPAEPVKQPAQEPTEVEKQQPVQQPTESQKQQPVQKQEAPVNQAQPAKQPEQNQQPAQTQQLNQFEQEVFELTNNERAKHGLSPLKIDIELSKVAREKSRDMAVNGYFDHNSPKYGSPFDMMRSYGISYSSAGENIAKGQRTPAEVVNAWMNSEGHRANILNGNFTHIGVGFVEQGNHWTQQFIGK